MRSLALVALAVFPSLACAKVAGSGTLVTESRQVSAFSEVAASGGVRLQVTRGPTSVTIEGDDNLVKLYSTEVAQGRLVIRQTTKERLAPTRPIVVRVTTPALSRLEASGGVEVSLDSVAASRFSTDLSGGVELDARGLEVDALELEASGGVTVKASGRATAARLNVSGGVELHTRELAVTHLALDASGGCDVDVTARESIAGEASGGVGVTVHGRPARAKVTASGGASVEYLD